MAEALASSNTKNFWQQVQSVNRSWKPPLAYSIDGHPGVSNISNLFSPKLQRILNSQDIDKRDSLLSNASHSLQCDDLHSVTISEECVIDAFSHLKHGKSDGSLLLSDHLIHALPVVSSSLANFFTAILHHGYMPAGLKDCILVPIPKSSKDPSVFDNYRAIALTPTLSKALEWCILLIHSEHFKTFELQFGFKQNMSTSLCTGILKHVVSRYMHEGSSFLRVFLMPLKVLIWLITTFSLVSCLLKAFQLISFVSSSHGIRSSVCVFVGGVLSRTAFLLQMVSVKGVFCLLSCSLFIWMTSLWI